MLHSVSECVNKQPLSKATFLPAIGVISGYLIHQKLLTETTANTDHELRSTSEITTSAGQMLTLKSNHKDGTSKKGIELVLTQPELLKSDRKKKNIESSSQGSTEDVNAIVTALDEDYEFVKSFSDINTIVSPVPSEVFKMELDKLLGSNDENIAPVLPLVDAEEFDINSTMSSSTTST
ncbi:hypothetical protein FO519_000455 [Halicephalobus sp. NKZ332]|nr:hypothetical protein FO519_000455 [Halicephalobus sp. NKZ332]